ncbi:MAG TPA: hypothetical protein VFV38_11405 [Ktedonobacteraceae bacterium]|nr:hypothetical protein [Ktedonobacteraceae bacterium]
MGSPQQGGELDGAGALLLLAAACSTDLITVLEPALACTTAPEHSRLAHLSGASCQMLLRTWLFFGVADVQRTWD